MRNRAVKAILTQSFLALTGLVFSTTLTAETQAPLSVIDWLGDQTTNPLPQPVALPAIEEPPVTDSAIVPDVSVQTLSEGGARNIGLVPETVTGLPTNLWAGSRLEKIEKLLAKLPDIQLPAAQSLLYTVLLTEASAPGGKSSAGDALALARVRTLVNRGALDPAESLIEQSGVTVSPAHFDLWMQISLLTGTEDRACAVLEANPNLTKDYGTRMFCNARAGRWEDAALILGSAQALGLMPQEKLTLFEYFIDPDAAENGPAVTIPRDMDPLSFRLFESIGEPVPTRNLPRPYAVADLRDVAGWKAQLEAAERLARAGALPDNRLLGLYSDRSPAASGGIWDRVAAVQRFDTALKSGSVDAVTKTLPTVWSAMRSEGLEVTFATLFAKELMPLSLAGKAQKIADQVQLLSPKYEAAAQAMAEGTLAGKIALGETPGTRPTAPIPAAIFDAFSSAKAPPFVSEMANENRLGEAILKTLLSLNDGARGNVSALTSSLASLRALGLEDTARRAALQILLLEG